MNGADLQSTLQNALLLHREGRLAEAERLYRNILSVVPEHPMALHHLGIVALQYRKPESAAKLIGRSIELDPSAAALNNLGEALRTLGRLPESVDCYQRSIAMDDRQGNAMANLGLALTSLKQFAEAEAALRSALVVAPNHASALAALANLLTLLQRRDDAVAMWERAARQSPKDAVLQRSLASAWLDAGDPYRALAAIGRAIELQPLDAQSHAVLSLVLEKLNRTDQAIAAAQKAVELAPGVWHAHQNLGLLLERAGQSAQAVRVFETAAKQNPRESSIFGAMASSLSKEGRAPEAIQAALRAIALNPADIRLHVQLGAARFVAGDYAAAAESARAAIKLDPHHVDSHAQLSFSLLAAGKYEEGFREYEWRWRDAKCTNKPRDFDQPLWDGSDPSGRTILVHSEQGFGDIFQFLRYVPLIRARGARVLIEVSYKVAGLVRRMAADASVIIAGTMLPKFDLHVPLASLPTLFGTTSASIPATTPYLAADPALAAQWRAKLGPMAGLVVGLVWAGSPKPDPRRSATLADMAPLVAVPGVTLIAMQPPAEPGKEENPPAGMNLKNWGPELRDFADTTASLLANLDLLITVDTGVAHLAGAMGIPTWILLRESPEWRWLLKDGVSPWYPTVRLFRQPTRGDWASVVQHVADELKTLAQRKPA